MSTPITTLCHSNETGGTTICQDGTKIFWDEGYSSSIILYSDGRLETVEPEAVEQHPLSEAIVNSLAPHMRMMTEDEETEWDNQRQIG
jgi:hypothetical protein